MSFFEELKRRNVIRVGIAYVIVAWLVLQFADVVLNNIQAPGWVFQVIMLVLGIGFPVVLIFAWAFEMTPEGIKKEQDVDRSQSVTSVTGQKLNYTIIGLLVLGLGYMAWDKAQQGSAQSGSESFSEQSSGQTEKAGEKMTPTPDRGGELTPAPSIGQSIAVLPFVNMSDDSANEYFSDGLSEELLNLLTKIPELKVAARTSSFQFKGKTGDIENIARQLKVTNVLEGSVRKSGNQVRITAQLIKADDGYHLWSETYDRTLENIFEVQDEIAAEVVAALKITLLGEAPVVVQANPEAYALFLQGRYLYNQSGKDNVAKSVGAYQSAIEIDPGYAPAWAGLALATLNQAGQSWIELQAGVAKARETAERAISLDPGLALSWLSLSTVQGNYDWNWVDANESMQKALQLEPKASDVLNAAADLASSLGQLDEAVALYRQVIAIDPLNQPALGALVGVLEATGLLLEAEETVRRLFALNPDYFNIHFTLGWLLLRQGNPEQALFEAAKEPDDFWRSLIKTQVLYSLERRTEADAGLAAIIENNHTDAAYQIAEINAWKNTPDAAFKWLNQAYDQHDPGMGNLLRDSSLRNLYKDPRWEPLLGKIGLLDAWRAMPDRYKEAVQ